MITALDCIPCFFFQLLIAARRADPGDEDLHRRLIAAWAQRVADLDLTQSPPAIAGRMYGMVAEMTGCDDIYAQAKKDANQRVLDMLPELRGLLDNGQDRLRRALEFSIVGNYMDCAVPREFDWQAELRRMDSDLDPDAYQAFSEAAASGTDILILGDNAGEIGLDTLLVEALLDRGCRVTYAVRGRPVINDATLEDARTVGMTELCEVVSSGVDTPGTVIERCDPAFLERMDRADLIVSKGQGNFEALCGERPEVWFAFKVKCPVVAKMTGRPVGHSMFCTRPEG